MLGNQAWIRPVVRARVGVCADNSAGDPLFAKGNILIANSVREPEAVPRTRGKLPRGE
jgi:hypothetical protein